MRLPLAMLEVFNAIAEQGSLRGAAQALGLKPSSVSHQLKNLEARIGTPLFIRTTRSVNLTEAGRALMQRSGPAFAQLAEGVESAQSSGHAARGSLKLALPEFAFDLILRDHLPAFHARYPEIQLDLQITDAFRDILDEGFHAGFRIGGRIAPDMIAMPLSPPQPTALVASPGYLDTGAPLATPADLLGQSCLRYRFESSGQLAPWRFLAGDGTEYAVDPPAAVIANASDKLVELALRHMGIAYVLRASCAAALTEGHLLSLLPDHIVTLPALHIYYPQEYRDMVPLRLLIAHLKDAIPQAPE